MGARAAATTGTEKRKRGLPRMTTLVRAVLARMAATATTLGTKQRGLPRMAALARVRLRMAALTGTGLALARTIGAATVLARVRLALTGAGLTALSTEQLVHFLGQVEIKFGVKKQIVKS